MMSSAITAQSVELTPVITKNGPLASSFPDPTTISDEMLYEVVDGRIVEKTVGVYEVEIANILTQFLGNFARTHGLGRAVVEMIFIIDRDRNLQRRPDVAFVSHARWPVQRRAPKSAVWDLVPDLVVEVVNPSNTADQVQEKIHEYFMARVSRVWVVYPRQKEVYVYASPTQIEVLQLGQELDGGDLVPGFRLPLAALFEDDAE
jgi:Uma2 family endonuclease